MFCFFFCRKKNNLLIDENYVLAVLGSINKQLLLHYASLSYAITNKDIVLCDVRLSAATECLLTSVDNLHTKIQDLKQLVVYTIEYNVINLICFVFLFDRSVQNKRNRRKSILLP